MYSLKCQLNKIIPIKLFSPKMIWTIIIFGRKPHFFIIAMMPHKKKFGNPLWYDIPKISGGLLIISRILNGKRRTF